MLKSPRTMVGLVCAALACPAWAAKISFSENGSIDVGTLVQTQYRATQDGAADGKSVSHDFLLRRARIILAGNYDDHISFLISTDVTYGTAGGSAAGNTGFNNNIILNEALASYRVSDVLIVDAGQMLLPFSHNVLTSSSRLATLDARGNLTKYALDSQRNNRDVGIEVRGLLFDERIYYRLGVWNGVQTQAAAAEVPGVNPGDAPRFAGMVRFNIFGKEDGYTWCGICFANSPTFNVGVSADVEPNGVRGAPGQHGDTWRSYVADVFLDLPLPGDQELSFEAALLKFEAGSQSAYFVPADGATAANSFGANAGIGAYGHIAYRIGVIAPVFAVEWFNSDNKNVTSVNPGNLNTYRFGLNWYVEKHVFNVKAEVALQDKERAGENGTDGKPIPGNQWQLTLQAQVAF
jgi:Phosphate-selective porin O and P